jgi:hypothetical protein
MKFIILGILIIIAILLVKYAFKNKENMEYARKLPSPNIVLMGDYDFHQPKNVKYPSLKKILLNKYPLAKVKTYTNSCVMINNINSYINNIPTSFNNNNTTIIVAVGMNDIYKNLLNCSSNKKISNNEKQLDCIESTNIYSTWAKEIDQLISKFNKSNIIILGTYYPKINSEIPACKHKLKVDKYLEEDLDYWNSNLSNYARNKNVSFIPVDKIIGENDLEKDGFTIKETAFVKFANKLFSEIKLP